MRPHHDTSYLPSSALTAGAGRPILIPTHRGNIEENMVSHSVRLRLETDTYGQLTTISFFPGLQKNRGWQDYWSADRKYKVLHRCEPPIMTWRPRPVSLTGRGGGSPPRARGGRRKGGGSPSKYGTQSKRKSQRDLDSFTKLLGFLTKLLGGTRFAISR